MFFLLRSAVCIGLVVAALPDTGRTDGPTRPAQTALAGAEAFCRTAPSRCLAIVRAGLRAGSAKAEAAIAAVADKAPSRDTLLAVDRVTDWRGPGPANDD